MDESTDTSRRISKGGSADEDTQQEILDRVKIGERWIIWLTALIVLTGAFQAYETWDNGRSTTQQTEQLIAAAKINAYAADRNAQAASNFAEAARGINKGVSDAVGRLRVQGEIAEATRETSAQDASNSLGAVVQNFRLEQRAWVSVVSVDHVVEIGKPLTLTLNIRNTGRTFAKNVSVKGLSPESVYSGHRLSGPLQVVHSHTGVLVAPETIISQVMDFGSGKLLGPDQLRALSSRTVVLYVHGYIGYNDVFGVNHVTPVCIYLSPDPIGFSVKNCNPELAAPYGEAD